MRYLQSQQLQIPITTAAKVLEANEVRVALNDLSHECDIQFFCRTKRYCYIGHPQKKPEGEGEVSPMG